MKYSKNNTKRESYGDKHTLKRIKKNNLQES